MKQNNVRVSSHLRVFRASLALAFVLSSLGAVRLAAGQTPPPDAPIKAETNEFSTLTLPPSMAVPALARPNSALRPAAKLGQAMGGEIEPNGFYTQASPIASGTTVRASIYPNADIDYYAFSAQAGDRVYAAIMGAFSTGSASSNDSQLAVLASDGITVIEFDDDNGSLGSLSSSIAGAVIPSNGTYYLRVSHFSLTNQLRPYELHFRVQAGAPTPEVEGNDTPATANPLAAGGWMSGTRNPAVATEQDWYSVTLAAGDTVFLSLDLDPERDGVFWNGRLGFALFGDAGNQILVVDDGGATETPTPTIPSEAFFITVKNAGTYYAFVDSATAATGGPTATYHLSVDIKPAADEGLVCAIYTSTDVPKALGPGTGLFTSTLTIPGHPRIADLDVTINLTHALMADLDVHLRSPAGNDNGLFTDIGAAATGGQTQMDMTFDDEAGAPPSFTVLKGVAHKPELAYRLAWFDGEDAGGTWTLDLRDDTANTSGGTLLGWSVRVCEPPPPPSCAVGYAFSTIFSTDFETSDAGFTHTGTADEWAYGTPATLATTSTNPIADFTTCSSGTKCWKTDLTGTYNVSSNQDLFSLPISLVTVTAPIQVSWAQRHQIENAFYDHAFVDAQQAGGATPIRLWEWLDPTMTDAPGFQTPAFNIGASAGWGIHAARADSLAGLNSELRFHLDSDTTVNFGGLAIDDVTVQGCVAVPPPAADAGADQAVSAASSVMLDGSGSSDPNNYVPLTYGWAQTGGPAVTLSGAAAVSPTFTAPASDAVLTFTLVVTNSYGVASTPDTVVITVTNLAPIADAGASQAVAAGQPVQLDGSASVDPDNHTPLSYLWVQTLGPAVTLSSDSVVSPTFIAPWTTTLLRFRLVVTDSLGLDSAPNRVAITVTGTPIYDSSPIAGSAITVGIAYVGSAITNSLTISNTGSDVLSVTSHTLSGPNLAEFSVSPPTLTLPDGSPPQELVIGCTPAGPGPRTATLTVNHNAAGSPATYALVCVGQTRAFIPRVLR